MCNGTRSPDEPDIAHMGILPQFGHNPFSGLEILSIILMFCVF